MKPAALNQMRRDVWGDLSDEDVLGRLKEFLQASSALSFAARGQQFTDEELRQLRIRAQDYVISLSYTLHTIFPPNANNGWFVARFVLIVPYSSTCRVLRYFFFYSSAAYITVVHSTTCIILSTKKRP